MGATFELRTLGTAELRGPDGRSVRALLAQPKRFALLVYLAAAQPLGFHRRDKLLALFWPDSDADHARTSLRKAVHVIRRALTEDSLLARGDEEIGINPDRFQVDVSEFETLATEGKLASALELYRGDLLPAFFVPGAQAFEEWLDRERARLRQRAADLARSLAEQYENRQQITLAVNFARRAVELSSLDERILRRLIALLDALGDRAGAVHAYEEFERRLATEFEVEPSGETRALIERVRNRTAPPLPRSAPSARPVSDESVSRKEVLSSQTALRPESPLEVRFRPESSNETPRIPGYAIERRLDEGGMAVVYLAKDLARGRPVAIKLLKAELAAGIGVQRFLQEIEITASFAHPHILPLLDSGTVAGLPFFVMPYVAGDSLRRRLQRERRLAIPVAIDIARQVADALACAHSRGVVHRDIKPENILFAEGHAVVADFGIARAAESTASPQMTAEGAGFGSPPYMSPEQARGGRDIDHRSDIYALGCVLFEMLVGKPPFGGSAATEIIVQHLVDSPPSLRVERPDAPRFLVDLVATALAKSPNDRIQSAQEFMEALRDGRSRRRPLTRLRDGILSRRALVGVAVAAILVATPWSAARVTDSPKSAERTMYRRSAPASIEPSTYAVFAVDSSAAIVRHSGPAQHIHDVLSEWEGIGVVPFLDVEKLLSSDTTGAGRRGDLRALALSLRAGRYARVYAASSGDSVRVLAALFHTATDSLVREATVVVPRDFSGARQQLAAMVKRLLVGPEPGHGRAGTRLDTRSLPALESYLAGHRAIDLWDFATADTAFEVARWHDPSFAEALLWFAQVKIWLRQDTAKWAFAVKQAADRREYLASNEALMSDALSAFLEGNVDRACGHWGTLATRVRQDFARWYALAECLRSDRVVIRREDGWSFRSSYWQAVNAYQRAFELHPSPHQSFVANAFADVRTLLFTSSAQRRSGYALPPDRFTFRAHPTWQAESLAFVPETLGTATMATVPASVETAVRKQREKFRYIATMWRTKFGDSPETLEAVAIALDMLGDRRAVDTLTAALTLLNERASRSGMSAADSATMVRLAATQIWILVKNSLPSDLAGIRRARQLGRALLKSSRSGGAREAALLGSLAALTGRASDAVAYAQRSYAGSLPHEIALTAPTLLVLAAVGAPADTMRALETRLQEDMTRRLSEGERERARSAWLMRAATLAYPTYVFDVVRHGNDGRDELLRMQRAAFRHDRASFEFLVDSLSQARRAVRAPDLTIDAVYPEAATLASLQRYAEAIAWIHPVLDSIAFTPAVNIADVPRAASLVRAMGLRAELAYQVGDRATARQWASAVVELWTDADDLLDPLVRRMKQLAR